MSANPTDLSGKVVASQFQVLKKLGAGGMGAVYLAEQLQMDRKVVVKVMHPELTAGSATAVERFKREAKAVAQLNHPNIVQIYVFGQTETGQMYIAMEYIEGRDLTDDLNRGRVPQARALKILDQVCAALIEAHNAGIVHRDLKPDNIMLTDRHGNPDYVKVLDFGIAKLADPNQAKLTQAGAVFGTPRYMAPEQAKGTHIDARADVYAIGVIMYEMLTGSHPFQAETALDYIVKHATEPITLPNAAYQGLEIAPRIEGILGRCLEKEVTDRYQSVRELQRDIRLALRDFPEAARNFPTGEGGGYPSVIPVSSRGAARSGGNTWLWALIAVLVLAGTGVGVVLAVGGDKGPPAPVSETRVVEEGRTPDKPPGTDSDKPPGTDSDKPPGTNTDEPPPPDTPPATAIAEGMPVDGFPLPARAKETTRTPQVVMFESDLSGKEIIQFYKAKLAGKYGAVTDIPSGIQVAGTDTPFNTVIVQVAGGDRVNLILSRNALYERPGGAAPAGPVSAFGVELPPGGSLKFKTSGAIGYGYRKPIAEICDHFVNKYGGMDGVVVVKDTAASTPYCNMVRGTADLPWQAMAIVDDPTSNGSTMVTVTPRQ